MKSESFLSDILNKYKTYRIASGRISNGYLDGLHKFERFCVKEYPSADKLSQGMIDKWCCKRKTEKTNSCLSRIYPVISLLRYTNSRNLTDLRIPLTPRPVPRVYIPHAFSEEELNNFFQACDSFETKYGLVGKIQRITIPVFFRLLYSSGMRTTEARLLRREDVCLEDGIVNIRYSKGYNQHFVVLHDSMLELMKRYDVAISKLVPERIFFFPTSSNSGYNGAWVTRIFRKCWYKKNEAYATAYELRHHYAVKNINSWIGQGLTAHQKLLSLSKSMGHSNIESTKYYYSLVPCLYDIIEGNTSETLNQIIPKLHKNETNF